MDILYVAQKHDYGDPTRGLSFEHYNFYLSLCAMGCRVSYFDYPAVANELGRAGASRSLEKIVREQKPDALFAVMQHDTIDRRAIRRISEQTDTVTINWFCDDHWQFDSLGKAWTPNFNYVVTTSQNALAKYKTHGMTNVIKSQWGANHAMYKPQSGELKYDVTFVGQPYGMRKAAVEALQRAGVRVQAWGSGWPGGKLTQDEMIRVFSQSKINLNFADASNTAYTRLQAIADSDRVGALRNKPLLWRAWDASQRLARWDNNRVTRHAPAPPRQIKGRTFEVPACGGFLMTQPAEDLADYLEPGVDCATFGNFDELVERVRYYLNNEPERRAIAEHGYQRTLAEHTYQARFNAIFEQAGLSHAIHPSAIAA